MASVEVSDRRLQFSQPTAASVEAEDWREGLTLLQRQKYMLEGQYGADIKFLVGPDNSQQTIMAHRFTLVSASEVFEELLRTRGRDAEDAIVITDVDPDAFREMLRYIYYEEVNLTTNNAEALLTISTKYQISQLAKKCTASVENNINVNTVCTILDNSVKFKNESLIQKCLSFISHHTPAVLKTSGFVKISPQSLQEITKSEELKDVEEIDILQACINWADARCIAEDKAPQMENWRAVLGEVLYQIRFPSMTAAEFTQTTRKCSLLTPSERADVLEHITLHNEGSTTCDCNIRFITKPRRAHDAKQTPNYKSVTVRRFRSTSRPYGRGYSETHQESIDLMCSKSVRLEGVGLFGCSFGADHTLRVQLIDTRDPDSTLSDTGNVQRSGFMMIVHFPVIIQLEAGETYSLVVMTEGFPAPIGMDGLGKVKLDDFTVTFLKSSHHSDMTTVDQGQIPEIYFSI